MAAVGCSESKRTPAAWQRAFQERVKGADSLVIVIRGGCDDDTEVATYRLEGTAAVEELVALIEIKRYDGEFVTLCGGRDTFSFARGDETLVKLTRTPLSVLTWDDPGWQGDAVISMDSYRRITTWFKTRGFGYFSDELSTAEPAAKNQQAENAFFVSDFPLEVQHFILRSNPTNGEINANLALRQMRSSRAAFLAICRCLGRFKGSNSSWTMTDPMTRAVLSLAHAADQSQFWGAVQDLSDDPIGQLGAARLYFREKIGSSIAEPDHLPLQLVLATRVLADGFDENKSTVIWHLSRSSEPGAIELLHQIAQGTIGTEIDPMKAWDDEPGIRFIALVGLAQRGAEIGNAEWEACSENASRPQDRAALEIAGNLIGKDFEIRVEHFRFRSYTLGEAAIEALARSSGPRSLGLLVEGAMEHPWAAVQDHAELAVQRMIGQSWGRHESRRKIDEWLATHSDAWIRPGNDAR